MEFNATFRNFGKIREKTVPVKPLTVLAGENSSGKSFATKGLYCILEALNQDHLSNAIRRSMMRIVHFANRFRESLKSPSKEDQKFSDSLFDIYIPALSNMMDQSALADLENQKMLIDNMEVSLDDIKLAISDYYNSRKDVKRMQSAIKSIMNIMKLIDGVEGLVNQHLETITDGIELRLNDNLKKNFQITGLTSLVNSGSEEFASVELGTIGKIDITGDSDIGFRFAQNGVMEIQKLEHVIFIDSPIFLKIRQGLTGNNIYSMRFGERSRYLKGYPLYVDHLYRLVDKRFIDKPDFYQISDRLQKTLDGRLEVSKSGDIDYKNTDGFSTPLLLTATGVSNLGLIELLIRNNVISKGSFLIIDEPEAHLHPKWQVELMDILYNIAKAGANVIVATHSLDMVKKLEVILKNDEDAEEIISINYMASDGGSGESGFGKTQLENAEYVLSNLSTPFYEMYLEGV